MKNFLFTLLVTVALLPCIHTTISAQPTPVQPAAGSGTEADPWQIATLENLYWIAATDAVVPSPTQATRWTKYFIQTSNIDASPTSTWFPNGSGGYYGWKPIGRNSDPKQPFTGGYNGQGFRINGLYINRPGEINVGLFGYIECSISNIGLTNVNITGGDYVGGLIGREYADGHTTSNCYVTGSVTGIGNYIGGLAGYVTWSLWNSGYIKQSLNLFSSANVTGNNYVGGLFGYFLCNMDNCYSTGNVTASGIDYVGGLLGFINSTTYGDYFYAAGSSSGAPFGPNLGEHQILGFWDSQMGCDFNLATIGTRKTTAEMKTKSNYQGLSKPWDFTPGTGAWQIKETSSGYISYPYLQSIQYDVPGTYPPVNPIPGLEVPYAGGDGTPGNPYQITNWRELSNIRINLSSCFILNNNLDPTGSTDYGTTASALANGGYGWTPIGDPTTKFTGNFNGNGHTIDGLFIDHTIRYYWGFSFPVENIGLFGAIGSGAVISNIGLTNVSIAGKYQVGGLVGVIEGGTVTNVYSTANVWGHSGEWGVGGLVGAAWDNITNAYSTGYVDGGVANEGGLIGWDYYITVTNSFWDTQTSGRYISAKGTGKTTSEMKLQSTFTGWDFTAGTGKWQIQATSSGPYKSYPYLQGFTYDVPDASPVVNPIPGLADLYYSGGTGTPENPYQIANLTDLGYLSENPNDWAKSFIQTANIEAAVTSGWNSGAGFSPIGNPTIKFTGSYNGDYHTIYWLTINRPSQDYVGLFGYVNTSGSISNLWLTYMNITGYRLVGGLVGGTENGTYTNVGASGNVSGTGTGYCLVGGLVGTIVYGTFTSVYTTGTVSGSGDEIGGLAGRNNSGSIYNSYSTANVSGASKVAGLAGYNSGTITNTYAAGSVTGTSNIGGLVGENAGTVSSSFWDTQTSGQATSAGGTGKTTDEMKNDLTFVGNCWDFQVETGNGTNDYWGFNGGYPFLSWQGPGHTYWFLATITIGTTASPTCGWSISDGVLTASMDVTINVDDINTALVAGNLTIQSGIDIIINTDIEPALTAARTLTLKARRNISIASSVSIAPSTEFALNTIFWSDTDHSWSGTVVINNSASINTKGGHLWIGGGWGSADWNGLIVGNGWAESYYEDAVTLNSANLSTSGGDILIKGESTVSYYGFNNCDGISISSGSINAGAGNVSLNGIGSQWDYDGDGIRLNGPITTTTGNITLSGSSNTRPGCEGISVQSNITSTSGNISLAANKLSMDAAPLIGSSGNLTLKPIDSVSTIGIAGGAGTLSLPAAWFTTNFVDGFSGITIGSSTAGNIGIKAIPFNDPVTFNAIGNLNLENNIDLNGQIITLGNEITLNETSGRFYGTTGNITTTRNLSNISAVNVAGLGATLTTTAYMGATAITRGHTSQSWGEKNSVLRYYDIAPTNNTGLDATLEYHYDQSELNGLTEVKLKLHKSTDYGSTYTFAGGTANTTDNTITITGLDGFSRWAAFEGCFNPTNGGAIATNQTICYNNSPAAFTSTELPSGHDGTLEYKWQKSTTGAGSDFSDILPLVTTETYAPGALTTTTWFKRLSKVICETTWPAEGESNVVQMTVYPQFTAGAIETTGQTICYNTDPSVIGNSTLASGGDNSISYQWQSSVIGDFTDALIIDDAISSTYDPPVLTSTTTYRRLAKDGTCNTTFTASDGTWIVTVRPQLTAGAIETTGQTICYSTDPSVIGNST